MSPVPGFAWESMEVGVSIAEVIDMIHFILVPPNSVDILNKEARARHCRAGSVFDRETGDCQECMAGSYHSVAKGQCLACPAGRYNPHRFVATSSFLSLSFTSLLLLLFPSPLLFSLTSKDSTLHITRIPSSSQQPTSRTTTHTLPSPRTTTHSLTPHVLTLSSPPPPLTTRTTTRIPHNNTYLSLLHSRMYLSRLQCFPP